MDGTYVVPTTCAAQRRHLRVWLRYLATVAQDDAPMAATVGAFRDWAGGTRRAASVCVLLGVVRVFYRWTQAMGFYPDIANGVDELPADGADPAALPH